MIEDGDIVSVIHFDTFSKIILKYVKIDSMSIRMKVAEAAMPRSFTNKSPNIWSALSLGLSLLKKYDYESAEGGNLILITDSKLHRYPNRERIFETVIIIYSQLKYMFKEDFYLS